MTFRLTNWSRDLLMTTITHIHFFDCVCNYSNRYKVTRLTAGFLHNILLFIAVFRLPAPVAVSTHSLYRIFYHSIFPTQKLTWEICLRSSSQLLIWSANAASRPNFFFPSFFDFGDSGSLGGDGMYSSERNTGGDTVGLSERYRDGIVMNVPWLPKHIFRKKWRDQQDLYQVLCKYAFTCQMQWASVRKEEEKALTE